MWTLWQDCVAAARQLRRAPLVAAAAILTLALGVGVNTAVFSIVNALILRPLPVRDADRLVVLARDRASDALRGVSAPDFVPYRAVTANAFEDIAGYDVGFLTLAPRPGSASRALFTSVTGNYFPLLGITPARGRLIGPDDVVGGRANPILVLGYSTWQTRFAADPSVIGRSVRVNGRLCTIVGVAPPTFHGTFAFTDSELYLPLTWDHGPERLVAQHAIGRLRPDVTLREAQAAIDVVTTRLAVDDPERYTGVTFTVVPERLARPEEEFARWNALASATILVLVGLVLTVATVNVANLLLARGTDRHRELAIRAAVGAGRARLIRQLLTEAALLAVLAGALGLVLAWWTGLALAALPLPGDLPVRFDFSLDRRVGLYAAAAVVLTTLAAGLWPAVRVSRIDVQRALRDGAMRETGVGRRGSRVRNLLVVAQMSACLVLLVVSGLLIRSLLAAERIDLGFRPGGVLNVGIDIAHVAYDRAQRGVLFDRVEEALRAIPGVDDVAFADTVPLGYIWLRNAFEAEAAPPTTGPRPEAGINSVSANYFRVMGIPLIDGRGFDDEETGTVAVVNERFAEMMWPGQGAVGRRFRTAGTATYIDVIGVTHTGKYNFIFEDPQPYVYFPFDRAADAGVRTIHVHTTRLTPERLAPGVERAIRAIEPEIVLFDVMSMQRALGGGFGFFIVRTAALFAVILGLLAVVLALVGLYGVMAYTVSRRTHEIGVRMAVGAARRDVARLVLAEGTVLIANGIVVGLPLSILSSGLVARFLVNVSPHDPLTYISVVVLLAAAALGACAIPAWRAARLEPLAALRDA